MLTVINDSAKLHTLRALVSCVLSCLTCLVPYMLSCLTCFLLYVSSSLTCFVPCVLSCITCFLSYVFSCLTCLVPRASCLIYYVLLCLTCSSCLMPFVLDMPISPFLLLFSRDFFFFISNSWVFWEVYYSQNKDNMWLAFWRDGRSTLTNNMMCLNYI